MVHQSPLATSVAKMLFVKPFIKQAAVFSLALSIGLSSALNALADPGDVNSINDGQVVQGGTYYNTSGGQTTFTNTGNTGLWIQSGTTVQGLEVNSSGALTGNGGHLHFYAPGQVVRIDGTIDVNALQSGSFYLGNGGQVTVDSAFLYQNGAIYANGKQGGLVQFNVGSVHMTDHGYIEAMGTEDGGGKVMIQAHDAVDMARGSVINTSGQVIGTYDTNIIQIEGGLVNLEGVLQANGILVGGVGSQGGHIALTAFGGSGTAFSAVVDDSTLFSNSEATLLNNRLTDLVTHQDGDIVIGTFGAVAANGADTLHANDLAGHGGSILLMASDDIENHGVVEAHGGQGASGFNPTTGGNGGRIQMTAVTDITNTGFIGTNGGSGGHNTHHLFLENVDNGWLLNMGAPFSQDQYGTVADASAHIGATGGNGGEILFQYGHQMTSTAAIEAKGGHGGNGANATAVDTQISDLNGGAYTDAQALGGAGGTGGQGGVIAFQGSVNLVASGSQMIDASGGQGGNGGNAVAQAWSLALNKDNLTEPAYIQQDTYAQATGTATAGLGGRGGQTGTIFAIDPHGLSPSQFQAKAGVQGGVGEAHVTGYSLGFRSAKTVVSAIGNAFSTADAAALDIHQNGALINVYDGVLTDLGAFNNTLFNQPITTLANVILADQPAFRVVTSESHSGVPPFEVTINTNFDYATSVSEVSVMAPASFPSVNNFQRIGPVPILPPPAPVFPVYPSLPPVLTGSTLNPPNADLLGLFQEERPLGKLPKDPPKPVQISLQETSDYLTSRYMPVTEEILALALDDFNHQLSVGEPPELAEQNLLKHFDDLHISPATAGALVQITAEGGLQVDPTMINLLQQQAKSQPCDKGQSPKDADGCDRLRI